MQPGFSEGYRRLLEEFAVQIGEREQLYGEPNKSVREEIVRCLWFGSHFPPEKLRTDDGRRIEVVSPGWWNVEGGPDFIRAEMLLEGAGRLTGDVEVHTNASSWYSHGHHRQPEYEEVMLHVVMWNDRQRQDVECLSGKSVPQLTLSNFVEEEVEELVEIVDLEPGDEGAPAQVPGRYCGRALKDGEIDAEWLGVVLDMAGDHRILTKADRTQELFETRAREQVLFERLAEALGYKNNRLPFMQLASGLTLTKLREIVPADAGLAETSAALEAAFFGVGGYLEEPLPDMPEEESERYLRRLAQLWDEFPRSLTQRTMSSDHWQFSATRPTNYPTRRIAALAGIYAAHLHDGLFGHLVRAINGATARPRCRLDTALRNALVEVFSEVRHPFWSHHYTFDSPRLKREQRLVGKERATAIIIDVLLPVFLADARSQGNEELVRRLFLLWKGMPRQSANAVTRRMQQVMFESRGAGAKVVNSARRQQGLHQLYKDFCNTEGGCERCVLYLAGKAGKTFELV